VNNADKQRLDDEFQHYLQTEFLPSENVSLDANEQQYLRMVAEGPARLNVLASRLGLPSRTVQQVTEANLIRLELIGKDSSGQRELLPKGREHLSCLCSASPTGRGGVVSRSSLGRRAAGEDQEGRRVATGPAWPDCEGPADVVRRTKTTRRGFRLPAGGV
jgi:hypothetical protein